MCLTLRNCFDSILFFTLGLVKLIKEFQPHVN